MLLVDASNRVRRVAADGTIATVAGSGTAGFAGDGGVATDAQLNHPEGVAVDPAGNVLVADTRNNRVRRVSPDGTIAAVAGDGGTGLFGDGGPATRARLTAPDGVAVDSSGQILIADTGNHAIRRIDREGTITTIAGRGAPGFSGDGGAATDAALNTPTSVAVARNGDVFIADQHNHRLRRVRPGGRISTFAGTGVEASSGDGGPAVDASLSFPGVVLALRGGEVLVSESGSGNRVRRIAADGTISTIAGGGADQPSNGALATTVALKAPAGLAFDRGRLLVTEAAAHRVWQLVALR